MTELNLTWGVIAVMTLHVRAHEAWHVERSRSATYGAERTTRRVANEATWRDVAESTWRVERRGSVWAWRDGLILLILRDPVRQ